MSTALTTGLQDQRSYEGSAEQISGSAPAADQVLTSVEFNSVRQAVDQHAPLINQLIDNLLAVIDGSDGVTLRTLEVEAAELRALLSSNDETLDTAQERVNKIKQLLSSVESLGVVDVEGLQESLDQLQSSIDASQLEIAGLKNSVGDLNLAAISVAKDITPVDIFIYDTKQDSDGGAWRNRCQGTSWYQEDLNTAARGPRREFPSVAVIVTDGSNVTIFDADFPDMPMWMVFNRSGGLSNDASYLLAGSAGISSVGALNGVLAIGQVNTSGRGGCRTVNFASDVCDLYKDSGSILGRRDSGIRDRNTPGHSLAGAPTSKYRIVDSSINALTLIVLPSAQVDPISCLPIPTIALGTDAGVSIVKDDYSIVNWSKSAGNIVNNISFRSFDNALCATFDSVSDVARFRHVLHDVPNDDIDDNLHYAKGSSDEFYPMYYHAAYSGTSITLSEFKGSLSSKGFIGSADAGTHQLSLIHADPTGPNNGLLAVITSEYNTGWMLGGCKFCSMSSTDDSDLVGNEDLVFDDDRSKQKEIIVRGTINRTAAADGTDLVVYSGFSDDSYLEQLNNSDLEFGTDDFCYYGWIQPNSTDSYQWVLAYGNYDNISQVAGFMIRSLATPTEMQARGGGEVVNFEIPENRRSHLALTRVNGIMSVYVNGVFYASASMVFEHSVTNATLVLGHGLNNSFSNISSVKAFSGDLALWKVCAGSLSYSQIVKIYNDEKRMFQAGAQSTLYGSSDSVLALDHDGITDIVHACTAHGRSDFDRLVRVGNTTDSTSVISAHNGLVVEA